ncbi:MAG TPA: four-carbon acid sugar kinase family protein [Tepidisphaeraceae bacterium]|jgi:uncharacterized protein YgbK (DUF1537 family)|nr:four-carbon acid sugar kinase family protein [Tepidisphaeraceae bacterium]
MRRILVIADDLSGTTEIAGIGHRFGLPTQILRDRPEQIGDGLTVLDTDSRSLDSHQAPETIRRFVANLDPRQFDLIYKKTDSAFRGQIRSEVLALISAFNFSAALLLPQNPSRGRTIANGEYRIDGTPLHQTSFANDPDHPATTSDVTKLIEPANGITICDASNLDDVWRWAKQITQDLLPAGSADFFTALLESRGHTSAKPFTTKLPGPTRLFICGSASAYSRELISIAPRHDCAVCLMPPDVFQGGDISAWASDIRESLKKKSRVLVAISQPVQRDSSTSHRLQSALAEVAARVLLNCTVDHLFLEGGATASAVCRRMRWNQFDIHDELTPGIVEVKTSSKLSPTLLIKPGSYPWPPAIWL